MPVSQADKAVEYADFAQHCLKIARSLPDRQDRITHREMAAEWIKLGHAMTEDAMRAPRGQVRKVQTKA